MNSYTSKWSLIFFAICFVFISNSQEVFSQCAGSTKDIIVKIFETSSRRELSKQKYYLKRDPNNEKRSGESVSIQDGDQIICEGSRNKYVSISVTVCNIARLRQINLYLNDYRSNENECGFTDTLKTLNGRIGFGSNAYIIFSHKNEWALSGSDGSFYRCFTKFGQGENQIKVSIKNFDSKIPISELLNQKNSDDRDLTVTVDHYLETGKKDDSDITIDVFLDDDGIVGFPK